MGHGDDDIRAGLIKAGWSQADVEQAFSEASGNGAGSSPVAGTKLPGTFTIIKETFQQFGRHWKPYVALTLLPLLSWIPFVIAFAAIGLADSRGYDISNNIGLLAILGILGIVFFIALLIAHLWTQSALVYAITHEGVTIRESLRSGWRFVLPMIWVHLVTSLIVLGGYTLFIVPGIILSITVAFAVISLFKEDKHGLRSAVESGHLVKGYWWAVFGRSFLIGILYLLLVFAPMMAVDYLAGDGASGTISDIVSFPISIVFGVLFNILPYRFYIHLRARKTEADAAEIHRRSIKYKLLVALGVVILVVGFLTIPILAIFSLNTARHQAQDAKQVSDVKQLQIALELYYADNGQYPLAPATIMVGDAQHDALTNEGFEDDLTVEPEDLVYMRKIEVLDPEGLPYVSSDGTSYTITFTLTGDVANLPAGTRTATPQGIY